jgi:hypothetical protein
MIKGYHKGKFLEFVFDDGKTVKYDLSTGESIGTNGKPVNSTSHKFKGYEINDLIDCIDDENYARFLRNVYGKLSITLKNFGTLLVKAKNFSVLEQYFSAGIKDVEFDVRYCCGEGDKAVFPSFSKCPKGLIKICREKDITLTKTLIRYYEVFPNEVHTILSTDYQTLQKKDIVSLLNSRSYYIKEGGAFDFMQEHNYNVGSVFKYFDRLATYEALTLYKAYDNFKDYVRMASYISPKFDKYPKNLLTTHTIVSRNYDRFKQTYDEERFAKQYKPWMEWKYKDWMIIYPKYTKDIKDEAVQQNNCVASYISTIIEGKTDVVFLRKRVKPDESVITVEVKNNKVVQAYRAYNEIVHADDREILKRYEEYLKQCCQPSLASAEQPSLASAD